MPDPTQFVLLDHSVFFSAGVDMPLVIKLNPRARTMARSMQKLFAHIAARDAKAAASPKASTIIFPAADTALQAAITLVLNRLNSVV